MDELWKRPVRRGRQTPAPQDTEPSGDVPFAAAVDHLLRRSGWAPRTCQKAREILLGGRMNDYRAAKGIRYIGEFTDEHAAEFMADMRDAGLAPTTLVKTRGVIVALQRFANSTPGYESGMMEAESLPFPRVPERIARVLTMAEETAVLQACKQPRDRLIVEVLLSCGLRAGELVALQLGDLSLEGTQPYITVRRSFGSTMTKSGRERIVPLNWAGGTLGRRLRTYAEKGRPKSYRSEVFLALKADAHGDHPALSPEALGGMLDRVGQDAGIRLHPHLFRHTWATRAANAGVPMPLLQAAGGWRSLGILRRYYTVERDAMLAAFGRAHRGT